MIRRLSLFALVLVGLAGCACPARQPARGRNAVSAREVLRAYRQAAWDELAPRLDQMQEEEVHEELGRLAAAHLVPHKDILVRHGEQMLARLPKAEPIDRDDWDLLAVRETPQAILGGQLPTRGEEMLAYGGWNPLVMAHAPRLAVLARHCSAKSFSKRLLLERAAPPTHATVNGDPARPVIATTSGEELFLISLRRTDQGVYLPDRIEWLKRKKK